MNLYAGAFEYAKSLGNSQQGIPPIPRRGFPGGALGDHQWLRWMLVMRRSQFLNLPNHPDVEQALKTFGKPKDWHLLALEQPTTASDGVRVAYVRNEAKRRAHALCSDPSNPHLTATTATKYLARHWPHIKSDQIRNLVEAGKASFYITFDVEEMVDIVRKASVFSCMQGYPAYTHPYRVYKPEYGWGLAYMQKEGQTVARSLVNREHNCFVRTYGDKNSAGRTQDSPGLHRYLERAGYSKEQCWPEGCKFAKIPRNGAYIAPYLDAGGYGGQGVREASDCFVRDDDGEFTWDSTSGLIQQEQCSCCGESVHEDDLVYVDSLDDNICRSCVEEDYYFGYGRNGSREYIHRDRAIEVRGQYYDERYADYYDLVQLYDGDWTHIHNVVFVEGENEYYLDSEIADSPTDIGDVVFVDELHEYHLRTECVWCLHNEHWVFEKDVLDVGIGHVTREDLNDYLTSLERQEVDAVCAYWGEDPKERLLAWDAFYAKNSAQVELI